MASEPYLGIVGHEENSISQHPNCETLSALENLCQHHEDMQQVVNARLEYVERNRCGLGQHLNEMDLQLWVMIQTVVAGQKSLSYMFQEITSKVITTSPSFLETMIDRSTTLVCLIFPISSILWRWISRSSLGSWILKAEQYFDCIDILMDQGLVCFSHCCTL